jgi:hypothetical protein
MPRPNILGNIRGRYPDPRMTLSALNGTVCTLCQPDGFHVFVKLGPYGWKQIRSRKSRKNKERFARRTPATTHGMTMIARSGASTFWKTSLIHAIVNDTAPRDHAIGRTLNTAEQVDHRCHPMLPLSTKVSGVWLRDSTAVNCVFYLAISFPWTGSNPRASRRSS